MTTYQDKIDNHCANVWEEKPTEIGKWITGVGMFLLIAMLVLWVVYTASADIPQYANGIVDSTVNEVTSFNLLDWLMSLPEWSDYVR